MKKPKLEAKIVKHAHRKRFYEYLREKGQEKLTLSHVYWYLFLRSGKGNVFHLADELAAGDLGIGVNVLRDTRSVLVKDGWVTKLPARRVPDWTINTTQFVGTQQLGSQELGTHVVGTHKSPAAVVLHSQYAKDASTSPSLPSEDTSSVLTYQSTDQSEALELSQQKLISVLTPEALKADGSEAEEKATPEPDEFAVEMPASGVAYNRTDVLLHMGDCWSTFKHRAMPSAEEFRLFTEVLIRCDENTCFPSELMKWAQTHILNPKLLGALRSVKGLHKAICGEGVSSTNGLLAQYKDHCLNPKRCGICVKKVYGIECAMGTCKNWVELDYNGEPSKYCAQCAKLADAPRTPCLCGNNCKGFCKLEVEMEEGDEPIIVGKGFDVGEAE